MNTEVREKMKILFLRSNPVNPDSRVEKAVNSLLKEGHEVSILSWDRNCKYRKKESLLNFEYGMAKVIRFGIPASYGGGLRRNLVPLILFQLKIFIWLLVNNKRYEVIHACDFDTAYISFRVSKWYRKKFVYDIFDYYIDAFNVPRKVKKFIESKDHAIINSADAVILCTEKRKEQIKGTKPKKLTIIHNTPKYFKGNASKIELNNEKLKIVYVGILGKGRFIKELVNIVKVNNEYELHIAGFGEFEDFIIESAKKYNNIIYYGKISYENTIQLESSCDIMTAIYNPSVSNHYYAAPNKFYEALMLGKPIIMAENTGMDSLVAEYKIGEVIKYTVEDLEIAIKKINSKKEEWPVISKKMNDLYSEFYGWDEMERRLLLLYRELDTKKKI